MEKWHYVGHVHGASHRTPPWSPELYALGCQLCGLSGPFCVAGLAAMSVLVGVGGLPHMVDARPLVIRGESWNSWLWGSGLVAALPYAGMQALLAFRVRCSGNSSSWYMIPGLGALRWGSDPFFLGENLCSCYYPLACGSLTQCPQSLCLAYHFFFVSLVVENLFC